MTNFFREPPPYTQFSRTSVEKQSKENRDYRQNPLILNNKLLDRSSSHDQPSKNAVIKLNYDQTFRNLNQQCDHKANNDKALEQKPCKYKGRCQKSTSSIGKACTPKMKSTKKYSNQELFGRSVSFVPNVVFDSVLEEYAQSSNLEEYIKRHQRSKDYSEHLLPERGNYSKSRKNSKKSNLDQVKANDQSAYFQLQTKKGQIGQNSNRVKDKLSIQDQIFKMLKKNLVPFFIEKIGQVQTKFSKIIDSNSKKLDQRMEVYEQSVFEQQQRYAQLQAELKVTSQQNSKLKHSIGTFEKTINELMLQKQASQKTLVRGDGQKLRQDSQNSQKNQQQHNHKTDGTISDYEQIYYSEGFNGLIQSKVCQALKCHLQQENIWQKVLCEQTNQMEQNLDNLTVQIEMLKKKYHKKFTEFKAVEVELKTQVDQSFRLLKNNQHNQKKGLDGINKIQRIVKIYNDNFLEITKRLQTLESKKQLQTGNQNTTVNKQQQY